MKYKPYTINDFSIDPALKKVIHTLLEIDDMNILITGAPCSGKTSLLYAIIRQYYGLANHQGLPENNLLFINSLKEQGINYFRNEMKTFCQSRCSIYGKKKMIIVDDLDMVNEQCQQVFRNYIDKYKNNIHFVSTCSNVQKVIESIQSRTHILKMDIVTNEQIRTIMKKIITAESMYISAEAQDYLLHFSNHSIRQMINYLEKIYLLEYAKTENDPLTMEMCKRLCSNISFQLFEDYIVFLKKGKLVSAIHILYTIHDYGYSVIDIFDYFFSFVKSTNLLTEDEKYLIIPYLCNYITFFHSIHENVIELALATSDIYRIFIPVNV